MFERRLKIFLLLIGLMALVMVARAAQLQVLQHDRWQERATNSMKQAVLLEAPRGKIVDFRGRTLASDAACIDAAVDYRAIVKDPDWIKKMAAKRLPPRSETGGAAGLRERLLNTEIDRVSADIDAMWQTLAQLSGHSLEEIEQARYAVRQRVELRRKLVWYASYQKAVVRHENQGPSPWYKSWLFDESADVPQPDNFNVTVAEQKQTHVILRNVNETVAVALTKQLDRLPGLELKESAHRVYAPGADEAMCHVLGRLSLVSGEEVRRDRNIAKDELRIYLPNDLIGREGLEALGEAQLRGSKGRMEKSLLDEQASREKGKTGTEWRETAKAVAGEDVRTAIDLDLQMEITKSFHAVHVKNSETKKIDVMEDMHGAAVVIDVPTGEVRAMVSYPTFDLNSYEANYQKLLLDQINNPLMNRATCAQYAPGSTVKTIIGSVAVTQGKLTVDEGIECTGYLVLEDEKGRKHKYGVGRCWVASQFESFLGAAGVAHHPVPYYAPHRGTPPNPDGFLTLADALERSCNVYFETVADRLKIDGVTDALSSFGLGRPTGVGILEMRGRIPHPKSIPAALVRNTTWFAGIGQGTVSATPIQMANVAATLARRGVWKRPKLLVDQANTDGKPETIDLHLSSQAMDAVHEGMIKVVNGPAGTGTEPARDDITVAAKTGSAQQTTLFSVLVKDLDGKIQYNPDGTPQRIPYAPGSFPWYQGVGDHNKHLAHAWFIGFAPAEHPKIAFCVLVEYGGSGGKVAGPIARDIIESCIKHGYLQTNATAKLQALGAR